MHKFITFVRIGKIRTPSVMPRSNLVKNSAIYALGDIVPKLLAFIIFPILSEYLSPEQYGIVSYVNTLNTFLVIACFLCLNTYYLVYYYRVEGPVEQAKLLGNITIFVTGLNIIITALLFLTGNRIFSSFGSDMDFFPYIAIGVATNFCNVFSVLPSALFRVQERPLPLVILNILKGVITTGLTLVLVIGCGFKAIGVLYAGLIVSAVFAVIFAAITYRNMIWNFDWKQIKHALKFSLPLLPGSIAYYIVTMSDRILIDKYLDLFRLGIYSTASSLALVLNIVSYGAYKAIEPFFFKNYGAPDFNQNFNRIFNAYFIVMMLGAVCIGIYAKDFIILLVDEQYLPAYRYVPFVLIGVVAASVRMMFSTVITAQSRTKINAAITIIGGAISVILNVLLLQRMGIMAACISSAVSTCFMLGCSIYFSKIRIEYGKHALIILLCCATVWVSVYLLQTGALWLSLTIKTILIFIVLYLALKILGVKSETLFLSLLKRNNS